MLSQEPTTRLLTAYISEGMRFRYSSNHRENGPSHTSRRTSAPSFSLVAKTIIMAKTITRSRQSYLMALTWSTWRTRIMIEQNRPILHLSTISTDVDVSAYSCITSTPGTRLGPMTEPELSSISQHSSTGHTKTRHPGRSLPFLRQWPQSMETR
jgi:hypothetical protein